MGAIKKRSQESMYKTNKKKISIEVKSDNFYRKVGRAITLWGAIEKSQIMLSQYKKITPLVVNLKIFRILEAPIIFSWTEHRLNIHLILIQNIPFILKPQSHLRNIPFINPGIKGL